MPSRPPPGTPIYSEEFKQAAVDRVLKGEYCAVVARELGCSSWTLTQWIRRVKPGYRGRHGNPSFRTKRRDADAGYGVDREGVAVQLDDHPPLVDHPRFESRLALSGAGAFSMPASDAYR